MKLDLLYEIDVARPWGDKPHPFAQREREQASYREALEHDPACVLAHLNLGAALKAVGLAK